MTWTFLPARQISSPSTTNSIRSSTQTQRPKSFPLKFGSKPAHSTNLPWQGPVSHTSSSTWYSKELIASLAKRYHRRFRPQEASGTPTPPLIVLFTISTAPLSHSISSFPHSSKWSSARLFPRKNTKKKRMSFAAKLRWDSTTPTPSHPSFFSAPATNEITDAIL